MYSIWVALSDDSPVLIDGVWRADALDRGPVCVLPTGWPPLDAVLPGGGWPGGQLTEWLQGPVNHSEWLLLAPLLGQLKHNEQLALVSPPFVPHAAALNTLGLAPDRTWSVHAQSVAHRLWAAEQLLRCEAVGMVLLWLPQATATGLRRLQAAAQAHRPGGQRAPWAFVMRPWAAAPDPSPAPLRVQIQSMGAKGLRLNLLKRRGPPLLHPIDWPLSHPVASILSLHPTYHHVLDRARVRTLTPNTEHLVGP
jgi:protein ImuA